MFEHVTAVLNIAYCIAKYNRPVSEAKKCTGVKDEVQYLQERISEVISMALKCASEFWILSPGKQEIDLRNRGRININI